MAATLPAFTPVEASLYLTLAGRALDSERPGSLLGDTMSARIAEEIGYDLGDFPMAPSKTFDIAVRARILDDIVRGFVARHPDAVVLELGAGLDPRIHRVEPPDTVDWYDVDLAEVIRVRGEVLPPRPNVHPVAADVAASWLDRVPADRPVVAVADGLIAFLPDDDVTALLHRLAGRFPEGELAFNAYTRFHVWAIRHYRGADSIADVVTNSGMDDPHEVEHRDPRLKLVEELFVTRAPEVARMSPGMRVLMHAFARSTYLSRRGTAVWHYRF